MTEDSFRSLLKAENIKLKKKIEELEDSLLNITGSIKLFSSGVEGSSTTLNSKIDDLIDNATSTVEIITPKVGPEYAKELIEKAKTGINIQIVINDRRLLTQEQSRKGIFAGGRVLSTNTNYAEIYDKLKTASNIDLVNNPNVQFVMCKTEKEAVFSAGWLEKPILENTVLLGTYIRENSMLKQLTTIYKELLPSFMR